MRRRSWEAGHSASTATNAATEGVDAARGPSGTAARYPSMAMLPLHDLLTALAAERPVFHSEADFQHAFAWLLQCTHADLSVRLEVPTRAERSVLHLDVLVSDASQRLAIELKYKTRALAVTCKSEEFRLADQAAQDCGRYDFVKDIQRLERLGAADREMSGCAILLTNDSAYWQQPRPADAVDAAFRLNPGRTISGELAWRRRASAGTVRGREKALTLAGRYAVAWRDYSNASSARYGTFRYLAIEVPSLGE